MMKTYPEDHIQLLAEIAQLYYKHNLDQSEIAKRMGVSRSSVSRLLTEAREQGVVEFRFNFPIQRNHVLEQQLAEHFNLKEVLILSTEKLTPEQVLNRLARLASIHLPTLITGNTIIGITWGRTVYEVTMALPRIFTENVDVVQVIGAVGRGPNANIDGIDVVRLFADRLGAQYNYLHSPLLVEDAYVRDAMLHDHSIRTTLDLARKAHILVTGIGSLDPQLSAPLRAGYINRDDLIEIANAGGIGEFCGYHINLNGEPINISLNERVVGVTLDEVKNIPNVVGIVNGLAKAQTTFGVLRGGLLDTLIADDKIAQEVSRLAGISQ